LLVLVEEGGQVDPVQLLSLLIEIVNKGLLQIRQQEAWLGQLVTVPEIVLRCEPAPAPTCATLANPLDLVDRVLEQERSLLCHLEVCDYV